MSRLYLWFALCTFFCTGTAGASRHPAFPAPSVSRGHNESANLGRIRAASTSPHIRCLKIPSKSEACFREVPSAPGAKVPAGAESDRPVALPVQPPLC
jgi:hypothetical protein